MKTRDGAKKFYITPEIDTLSVTTGSPLFRRLFLAMAQIVQDVLWLLVAGVRLYNPGAFPALTFYLLDGLKWVSSGSWLTSSMAQGVELCFSGSSVFFSLPIIPPFDAHSVHSATAT